MALTKVTGQVIKNTTDVTVGVLTVTNTLAVGGTVSIGGTLTYEDVTNVDAVGLITARNGIVVGSGITLSKDGDVFFTGIATGNGSGLTALNASNISSGTVPTARLGSGTASSSTFLRGDSTFQVVNTDLSADSSPQLGGALDTNGNNINFGDSTSNGVNVNRLRFGTATNGDLALWHDGSNSYIVDQGTGELRIRGAEIVRIQDSDSAENMGVFNKNGSVELYHNNIKQLETYNGGIIVTDNTSTSNIRMDTTSGTAGYLYASGSTDFGLLDNSQHWLLKGVKDGKVELRYDNSVKLETTSQGVNLEGNGSDHYILDIHNTGSGKGSQIRFRNDHDASANIGIVGDTTGDLRIYTEKTFKVMHGSEDGIKSIPNGAVELYNDNTKRFETESAGTKARGTVKFISEDQNVTSRQNLYYLPIGTNSTSTITLSGLNGTGLVRIGGYTNAGQGAIALHIIFGGAMFATQHYQSTELQNSAMQNTSISLSKNSTNYTIAISNSSSSYSLNLSVYLESTGSVMSYAVS